MKPPLTLTRRETVRVCVGWVLCALTLHASPAEKAAELPEYQLKAAFLYNFAKFITWPGATFKEADAPLVLTVLGEDPFGATLEQTLAGKLVNGHPIQINRAATGSIATNCHILFIARSERERLNDILRSVAAQPVLTVSDADRFAQDGGMINLLLEGKAVRFEININATDKCGFTVNPKLGGLGRLIRGPIVVGGGAP